MKIKVCMGNNCVLNGAMEMWDQISSINELIEAHPENYKIDRIELEPIKCQKICKTKADHITPLVIVDDQIIDDYENRLVMEHIMKLISK